MAEIRLMSFNFAPKGWAQCDGQFMAINQDQALFALLGTTYGGNGQTTFQLPDLRGRVPIDVGTSHAYLGERGGEESHTLVQSEMPTHTHAMSAASGAGDVEVPTNATLARTDSFTYANPVNLTPLDAGTVSSVGGSQPHNNVQPYSVLNFCIALTGIFPSRD
jgi:microcystin-dependent protein